MRLNKWLWLFALLPRLAAAEASASPAQQALFDADHLQNIAAPTRVDYAFSRSGSPSLAYDDKVVADIRAVHHQGGRDVWISFLSGERQMPTTPAMNYHGNPLLMYYLEHDVMEMRQETGQPAAFFRTLVRRALSDAAQITAVTIEIGGRRLAATDISITPFARDARLAELPSIAGKSYDFVLCDQVPGTLYQIRSQMAATEPAGGQIVESMTFQGAAP